MDSHLMIAEIDPEIVEMDELSIRCEAKLGAGKKLLDHPIPGPLTAAQWRKFHLVHGLHQVKRIRRLRAVSRARVS